RGSGAGRACGAGRAAQGPAGAHRLRPHRARTRHRAARGRPRHRDAQRARAQARQPGVDRERRGGASHLHGGATPLILEIRNLDVYYGRAHALQGVSLGLAQGVLAVVGRNGMGKTTLCNAVTGLVRASGSVKLAGEEILGSAPNVITAKGVGYVPQGRRVWPSLSVDEHLRLARRRGPWTVERIYQTFPRLAERKANGGAELSGGEQQMLAISRALLSNPRLLVMDEPTEGLAPIVVEQLTHSFKSLTTGGELSILLIEQSLGVATDVSNRIAIMINGRIAREISSAELKSDLALQHRLLGVGRHEEAEAEDEAIAAAERGELETRVFAVRRMAVAAEEVPSVMNEIVYSTRTVPTRWS